MTNSSKKIMISTLLKLSVIDSTQAGSSQFLQKMQSIVASFKKVPLTKHPHRHQAEPGSPSNHTSKIESYWKHCLVFSWTPPILVEIPQRNPKASMIDNSLLKASQLSSKLSRPTQTKVLWSTGIMGFFSSLQINIFLCSENHKFLFRLYS